MVSVEIFNNKSCINRLSLVLENFPLFQLKLFQKSCFETQTKLSSKCISFLRKKSNCCKKDVAPMTEILGNELIVNQSMLVLCPECKKFFQYGFEREQHLNCAHRTFASIDDDLLHVLEEKTAAMADLAETNEINIALHLLKKTAEKSTNEQMKEDINNLIKVWNNKKARVSQGDNEKIKVSPAEAAALKTFTDLSAGQYKRMKTFTVQLAKFHGNQKYNIFPQYGDVEKNNKETCPSNISYSIWNTEGELIKRHEAKIEGPLDIMETCMKGRLSTMPKPILEGSYYRLTDVLAKELESKGNSIKKELRKLHLEPNDETLECIIKVSEDGIGI